MMEPRLKNELAALAQVLRRARLWREMTVAWLAVAALGILFLLLGIFAGWHSPGEWIVVTAWSD